MHGIIGFLLIGLAAGWISGMLMKGAGFGLTGNLIVGVVGAFLGGFLAQLLGMGAENLLGQLIIAVIGAMLFLIILRAVLKKKGGV